MFTVFKAYGKISPYVYYGYTCTTDVEKAFFTGTKNTGTTGAIERDNRADVRLLEMNGGNEANIMVEEIDIFDTEEEAWIARNQARADDNFSITGPTPFPINLANRVAEKHPELTAEWKKKMTIRRAKTARMAWKLGRWTNDAIKGLQVTHSRKEIVEDLNSKTPDDFALKYFSPA